MALNEYVGNRYVPLIDGVWSSTNTYEPLTVVTWEGNSYTSRCYVPAGVDISNNQYWVQTGNYNAQVEDYRKEVQNLSTKVDGIISTVNDARNWKNTIFIADSYGELSVNWADSCASYLGLSTSEYYKNAIGGSGFAVGKTFLTQLQEVAALIPDKTIVPAIVVCGGFNDAFATSRDTVLNAIKDFMTYVKSTFINAKVYVGEIGWSTNAGSRQKIVEVAWWAYKQSNLYGGIPLQNVVYSLHYYPYIDTSGFHPNSSGSVAIAKSVYNALNGNCNVDYTSAGITLTFNTDIFPDNSSVVFAYASMHNDTVLVNAVRGQWTTKAPYHIAGDTNFKLGTISSGVIQGSAEQNSKFWVPCLIEEAGTKYTWVLMELWIGDNLTLYGKLFQIMSSGSGFQAYDVEKFWVFGGTGVFSSTIV